MIKNNHGWGMREMIVFSSILIGFLLLAVILVNQLYTGIEQMNKPNETPKGYSYQEIELNIKTAAKKYNKEHPEESIIYKEDLVDLNYLKEEKMFSKKEQDTCTGYVIIEDEKTFLPFISCNEYETEGY